MALLAIIIVIDSKTIVIVIQFIKVIKVNNWFINFIRWDKENLVIIQLF